MRQMTENMRGHTMLSRIAEFEGKEYQICGALTKQNFGDDSSKESEPEG
jgi:hypothetical protein